MYVTSFSRIYMSKYPEIRKKLLQNKIEALIFEENTDMVEGVSKKTVSICEALNFCYHRGAPLGISKSWSVNNSRQYTCVDKKARDMENRKYEKYIFFKYPLPCLLQ